MRRCRVSAVVARWGEGVTPYMSHLEPTRVLSGFLLAWNQQSSLLLGLRGIPQRLLGFVSSRPPYCSFAHIPG